MTSDSSTGRLPRHDEPAPAGDPVFGPEPVTEPRAAYVPPHATPTSGSADAPFGAPVGAPPPYWHTATPADRRRRRQHWAGAILIIIGLLILGSNLGLLRWARPEYVLPLILVVAGAWLLFGRGRRG